MYNRLIIAVMIFVAVALLGLLLVWPKYQDFQLLRGNLEQKKIELSSKRDYYDYFRNIGGKLEQYNDVLPQIDAAISEGYSLPALFYYLQRRAGESGLISESIQAGEISGSKEVKEINISFKVSGTYSSLKSFLYALENSARLFNIKKVNFSIPERGGPFSFDLELTTYSY
ncbi:MAG: type 4a pilus biogenesis protein PilO [Candidatus Nealsonbacteria bacterium]|nr:type 4a pilus biogenesis protein PilO [Candidatus Nealsonbacteria bacterium]